MSIIKQFKQYVYLTYMITILLVLLGIFIGFNIQNNQPYISNIIKDMEPKLFEMGYNLVYFYSLCQIQLNKIHRTVEPFLTIIWTPINRWLKLSNKNYLMLVLLDNDGNEVQHIKISCKDNIEDIKNQCNSIDYSSLILLDKNPDTGYLNRIFYDKFPDSFDYKKSSINFMSVELEHNNAKHSINLKDGSHNYYIINNPLNQNFFKYYLKQILKVPINESKFDYKLTIIDHNINIVNILPHQHIVIDEHDYNIYPPIDIDIIPNNLIKNTLDTHPIINNFIVDNPIVDNPIVDNTEEYHDTKSESDKSDDFVKLETNT